jgi:dTDP-4-amino-4,6-dideoxygalactose transaminase
VGVPLFCCGVVFEAIVASGHVPVFLDINPKTYNLDGSSLIGNEDKIHALIVPHMFGYPADLDHLRSYLNGKKVPIIEDCAHALFSEYKGRITGSWTEMSVLSFGLHKPAEAGGGGMLLVNDPGLAKVAARELANLRGESKWGQFRRAFRAWRCNATYQRLTYGAALASPLSHFIDRNHAASGGLKTDIAHLRWSPTGISAMNQVLVDRKVREFQEKMPLLARNTQKLRTAVSETPLEIPDEPSYGKWNHFWIPVKYATATQCRSGRQFLRSRRLDVSLIWPYCVQIGRRFGYQGGCGRSEEAAQTVCRIPHYAWLSDYEIEYVGQSLRQSLGEKI